MFKKLKQAIELLYYYVRARLIMIRHYDKRYFESGKWFCGGRYGRFTAEGWRWVVENYSACKRMKVNKQVPWPCSPRVTVICPENIMFHPDDLNNFQSFGIYYQAIGKLTLGKGTFIGPNVGLITANHSLNNLEQHDAPREICIGEKCWIGMNSVILPGVVLGNSTIVGAGSVVTKSFPEGNCVVAGNPAKIIRYLSEGDKDR